MSWKTPHESFDDFELSLDRAIDASLPRWARDQRDQREYSRHASLAGSLLPPEDPFADPLALRRSQDFPRRSGEYRRSLGHSRNLYTADDIPLMPYGLGPGLPHVLAPALRFQRMVAALRRVWRKARAEVLLELQLQAENQRHQDLLTLNEGTGPDGAGLDGDTRVVGPHKHYKAVLNAVLHAKYNPVMFVPVILYEQFKFFFNLYFLLVALSQAVPALRIGYLLSYVVPLVFVLVVTMTKEAGDDLRRRRRAVEQNNELYDVLDPATRAWHSVMSKNLRVGDIVRLHKHSRVPADMVLLQLADPAGEAFIKTDQLDGETDWKLRVACPPTQSLPVGDLLAVALVVPRPAKSIHSFLGRLVLDRETPLSVDNTLWANTVLALAEAVGCVVYTGVETRQALNTTMTGVKTGLLELEINSLLKILCVTVFALSLGLVLAHRHPFQGQWYVSVMRFLILFSTIIPVSLRVNLDLAKSVYAGHIKKDPDIAGTIVRTSTIPEDLGRIEYLMSDKTGTLTQNDMELRKLHLGSVCYAGDALDIVASNVARLHDTLLKRTLASRVGECALVLALCHNVTPADEDGVVYYQAASPDEIAIVKFCENVGLRLTKRDRHSITLQHTASGQLWEYRVLHNFPFSSETKRMGIVVQDDKADIWFFEKGADTVMARIVVESDWLDEETGNMAREGLRTLVVGRKKLSAREYEDFARDYEQAALAMHERDSRMQRAIAQHLETGVELMGLTGVEDKLQENVKALIELLRQAGIKIWMLTGDKVETAKCVAILAKLITRGQAVHQITRLTAPDMALMHLEGFSGSGSGVLLIDGESLAVYMKHYPQEFFAACLTLPAVIACRCTPQQKADIVVAIKKATGKRVCCIGDGGNDVSMIQCADVGVGIVGKEGKQASLAADFSINQFWHLQKLLLWHGRNSYKRLAKLAQFIIHRGLIILVAQAIYSILSEFEPLALYQGWLMVGYSTLYTMAPVFLLTLDKDIDESLTTLYPELYKELTLGRSLSYKTFFVWVLISLFQGSVIQLLSQKFQTLDEAKFTAMVAISFTSLVFNELMMVALTIQTWNRTMAATLVVTCAVYVGLVPFLAEYFDLRYIASVPFYWQTALVLVLSLIPVWLTRAVNRRLRPPTYAKVQQH